MANREIHDECPPNHANEKTSDSDETHPPPLSQGEGDDAANFESLVLQLVQSRDGFENKSRQLGVIFRNLDVVGTGSAASHQATMGSTINPANLIPYIQRRRHPPIRDIISDFEGVVRPGEMLLVLGRPGSGCTTLLKVLANRREEFHAIRGEIRYDTMLPDEILNSFRGDVQYCPENDIHFPTLTAWQTIQFAARLRAPPQPPGETRVSYAGRVTDLLLRMFGLQHAKKTLIGDAAIHGVSGGEKKRVSICEALATRAGLTCWDNSTRGLDSSTALEFLKALRHATDMGHLTTIASLYQTGEQLYKVFDKVCLIYEGKMAYFGPADKARQYFIDMGYEPEPRQTTADFLVSVTDPNARRVRVSVSVSRSDHNVAAPTPTPAPPRSAAEFAAAFRHSALGQHNSEEVTRYLSEFNNDNDDDKEKEKEKEEKRNAYITSAISEHSQSARKSSVYLLSIPQQATAMVKRSAQIFRGDVMVKGINLFAFTFQGIIMGTVFLKVPDTTTSFYSRSGVIYFALLFSALMSMSEIPALFSQRPIVLRHRNWGLYHPFIDAVALTIVDIPLTFISCVVFSGLLYLLVGLQKSVGQFFIFFLFIFVNALAMKAFFRAIAAACKSIAVANTVAGIFVFVLSIYTGYTIPERAMIWPLRWITYINPFKYGFEALMVNEFHTLNATCTNLVPQGPSYENVTLNNQVCTTVGSLPGEPRVQGSRFTEFSLGYSYRNLWRDFGILVAFGVVFACALFLFTEVNTGMSAQATNRTHYKLGTNIDESEGADTTGLEKMISSESKDSNSNSNSDSSEGSSPDRVQHAVNAASKTFAREVKTEHVFTFSHIGYTIPVQRGHGHESKQLLDDVSGFVAPGKLTALMGETGSGKTTLLNVLAGRSEIGIVKGDRFINGRTLPEDFQSQTGYCQQLDTHIPRSTVREALLFSAKLRQPTSVPLKEKEAYVDTLLHICGLWSRRHAMVGSLSLEYSKRTTIGVELAAKPKLLLFLDEPTSGLDSQSAWNIVAFLKNLAVHGLAVLCTIHQPSAELFYFFDALLLLQTGGQTVYFGDLGPRSETLLNYFVTHGARPCGPEENPAEYMLETIGAGSLNKSSQNWHNVWLKSAECLALEHQMEEIHHQGLSRPVILSTSKSEFATPWRTQLVELVKRGALDYYRNSTYLTAKLTLNLFCGLFIGFSFYRREQSLQGTQNKIFSIFMGIVLSVPLANQLQVPYIATRTVYETRERHSRVYSWTALVTSQILVELPWNILGSTLYFLTWYWTSGFSTSRAGYAYLAVGLVFPLYYTTISLSIASMAPTAEVAGILFGFLFSFVLTFNGVMQPFRALGWWKWMYHLSPFTYLIGGLVAEVLGHQRIVCSPLELVHITPPAQLTCVEYLSNYMTYAGGYLVNPEASSDCLFCAMHDTDEFLSISFNIFYTHRWRDLGLVIAFSVLNIMGIYLFSYLFRFHKWGTTSAKFSSRRHGGTSAE